MERPAEGVTAVDLEFRTRRDEVEYCVIFRVNPVEFGDRTAEFYVDNAGLVVGFRSVEPDGEGEADGDWAAAALDGIGIDHSFRVMHAGLDRAAVAGTLARLAVAWWFDQHEQEAEPIVLANARLIAAVLDPRVPNLTAVERRVAWREIPASSPRQAGDRAS